MLATDILDGAPVAVSQQRCVLGRRTDVLADQWALCKGSSHPTRSLDGDPGRGAPGPASATVQFLGPHKMYFPSALLTKRLNHRCVVTAQSTFRFTDSGFIVHKSISTMTRPPSRTGVDRGPRDRHNGLEIENSVRLRTMRLGCGALVLG